MQNSSVMCKSYNVRKLTASEIEIKPCQIAKDKTWVQVLCYKTSRVDMQVLTEMYGSHWKSEYNMVGDSLFCTISVYDQELGEWISRSDCGEKDAGISEDKSWATSAFKRAATQFGIGMELYSTPRITFNTKDNWFGNDGKLKMTFSVKTIEWDGDTLVSLVIVDRFGNVVYSYGEQKPQQRQDGVYIPQPVWDAIMAAKSVAELANIWNSNSQLQVSEKFKRQLGKKKAELRRPA